MIEESFGPTCVFPLKCNMIMSNLIIKVCAVTFGDSYFSLLERDPQIHFHSLTHAKKVIIEHFDDNI